MAFTLAPPREHLLASSALPAPTQNGPRLIDAQYFQGAFRGEGCATNWADGGRRSEERLGAGLGVSWITARSPGGPQGLCVCARNRNLEPDLADHISRALRCWITHKRARGSRWGTHKRAGGCVAERCRPCAGRTRPCQALLDAAHLWGLRRMLPPAGVHGASVNDYVFAAKATTLDDVFAARGAGLHPIVRSWPGPLPSSMLAQCSRHLASGPAFQAHLASRRGGPTGGRRAERRTWSSRCGPAHSLRPRPSQTQAAGSSRPFLSSAARNRGRTRVGAHAPPRPARSRGQAARSVLPTRRAHAQESGLSAGAMAPSAGRGSAIAPPGAGAPRSSCPHAPPGGGTSSQVSHSCRARGVRGSHMLSRPRARSLSATAEVHRFFDVIHALAALPFEGPTKKGRS